MGRKSNGTQISSNKFLKPCEVVLSSFQEILENAVPYANRKFQKMMQTGVLVEWKSAHKVTSRKLGVASVTSI